LGVHPRRHVVGQIEELAAACDPHQHGFGAFVDGHFHGRDGVVDRLDGAAEVDLADDHQPAAQRFPEQAAAERERAATPTWLPLLTASKPRSCTEDSCARGSRSPHQLRSTGVEVLLRVAYRLLKRRRCWLVRDAQAASGALADLNLVITH
jgi:hypothetical protein